MIFRFFLVLTIFSSTELALPSQGRSCLNILFSKLKVGGKLESPKDQTFFDKYQIIKQPFGEGKASVVYLGIFPKVDLGTSSIPGSKNWTPGQTRLLIKQPRPDSINQDSIPYEYSMSQRLENYDRNNLFARYYLDLKHNLLISEFKKEFITLKNWLKDLNSPVNFYTILYIKNQLDEALKVLRTGNLVHSDFSLENILINPFTRKLKIIDFGIMAEVNSYPTPRKDLEVKKRGGRFKSVNQKLDLSAQFADDEYAVNEIIKIILSHKL